MSNSTVTTQYSVYVGREFKLSCMDGYACYRVTDVRGNWAKLELVDPYYGDEYQDVVIRAYGNQIHVSALEELIRPF